MKPTLRYFIHIHFDYYEPGAKESQEKIRAGQLKNAAIVKAAFIKEVASIKTITLLKEEAPESMTNAWTTQVLLNIEEETVQETLQQLREMKTVSLDIFERDYGDLPSVVVAEKKAKIPKKEKSIMDFLK